MFMEMDKDLSEMVSVDELKESLKSEKFASFLESMGISTQDVFTLFMIIDSDHNGLIDLNEFVT
ncbi:CACNA1C, partial [Symbiodinium sp. KB8]